MKNLQNIPVEKNQLHFKEKVSYGLGNFSANLLLTTANTYMIYYYTDIVGIAAGIVGTLLLVAKIFDGFFDLGMGVFLDSKTPRGDKARPWIKRMAIPFGMAIILMYSVPSSGSIIKIIYAFITYLFAMFIFSVTNVPYNSMVSLISNDSKDRSVLSGYRNMLGSVGGWLLTVITLPMVGFFGSGKHGWFITAIIYGLASTFGYFFCYRNTRERVIERANSNDSAQLDGSLFEKIKTVSKNKYWWIVLGIMIITFISAGLGGINVYFCKYVLHSETYVGILGTANYIPMILGSIVLIQLAKKYTKKQIVMAGLLVNLIGCIIIAMFHTQGNPIILGSVLKGFGSSTIYGLIYAMFADTVDYGEWKNGQRAEGITFSAGSFSEKIGSGLGVVILGALLSLGGYIGGSSSQSATTLNFISFIFVYLPILIDVVSMLLLSFYKLDSIYLKIRNDLDK